MHRQLLSMVLAPLAAAAIQPAHADELFPDPVSYDLHGVTYDTSIDAEYIEIIQHSEGVAMTNQQPSGVVTSDGTWVVAWTQASRESAKDQSCLVSTSYDGGKTWADPVFIEKAKNEQPGSWAMLFCVPHSDRIYAFYWWDENTNPKRDAGCIYVRYSDDKGRTWSERHRAPIPRHAFDHSCPKQPIR